MTMDRRVYPLFSDSWGEGVSPVSGTAPKYLSLHEVESAAAFDTPEYKAATSTPWRNRIVESAIAREKRVFELYKSFR